MKKLEKLSFLTISFYAKEYNFLITCKVYVTKLEKLSFLMISFHSKV